ncbi:hypothetical protein Mal4_29160 [Maioricimonas rarisocia]|uniref:Vitamin K-dependent gamma-carboxylase n=1 Tax=Maioricimonas rarisocia TaxID=2528026 RepID=A0A517Z7Y1_9PLAN|nr:hypothetical protein [Maioricimonas rarisocia]QDU38587.1 hypothetical protein Mal4_29160 [Maioricimonas rarisocia]
MNDDAPSQFGLRWLGRATALFALLLLWVTWRLWTPQDLFPQIPLLEFACRLPGPFDWGALVFLILGLAGGTLFSVGQRSSRASWLTAAAAFGLLFLGDQHRLQPWAYQFALTGVILGAASRARTAVLLLQLLFASIYVHSALSKLDAAFFQSHGQLLLDGLAGAVGLDTELWPERTRKIVAGTFPVGELLIAAGLLWRRSRRPAVAGAVVMHLLLLATLGPLGLDHEWGVLLWNGYFVIAVPLLFWPVRDNGAGETPEPQPRSAGTVIAALATAGAVLLPLTPSYDHWLSWSLYSSRPAVVMVLVDDESVAKLPAVVRPYVGPPEPLSDWRPVHLDAWSFGELGCPVYPQLRFRLAVAAALADVAGLGGNDMLVRVRTSPDRRSGVRERRELPLPELRARLRDFRLNTASRTTWQQPAAGQND